jgi:PAS domain S-box-containing protein
VHADPESALNMQRINVYAEEALRWMPSDDAMGLQENALPQNASDRPRILLADDNADMRAYLQRVLVEAGYQVDAVDNGAAALAAIRKGPLPDLVLSDVMMPELDGFALLQALRTCPETKGVMVILLSARAGEEARLEGLAAGADDYMVKPFSARELRARIDGAIALARQRWDAAAREQALRAEIGIERDRAALRESEAHVASLFEQTAAGIAETDMAGRLVRVNDRYCDILRSDRDKLIGQPMQSFIHPDDLEENLGFLDTLLRTGEPFTLEDRYRRVMRDRVAGTAEYRQPMPDGGEIWCEVRAYPTADGGLVSFFRDVTERRAAEDKLHAADRRKDEFLAMLAHELRNPLAPISAAADLLRIGRLDEARVRQSSAIIGRQVRHMTSLVDDLLDVSRVTRGLVTLARAPVAARTIVDEAIEQVRPMFEARRQHLAVDIADPDATVLGDRARLVQVLANLLNNAAKYTQEDRSIDVAATVDAARGRLLLVVRDQGIGIEPELTGHVFDLFTQAQRSVDRAQGGLGLGLALVKNLVELHGGTVLCTSPGLGQGSTFEVALPLMAPATHAAPRAATPDTAGVASGGRRPLRLLVVDDNVDAAATLGMLLEACGYLVEVEHDSHRALERARQQRPDVALLDIGLPDMDGNELARRLRADAQTGAIVLVAVTGYGQEQDRRAAFEAGFDHHLVKPVDMDELAALLANIE